VNAGMTFDTATNSVVIIAAPASAKAACFTTRMNAVSRFEKVKFAFLNSIGSRIGGSRADLGALAQEIVEDLKVTFEPFRAIADNLGADVLTDKDQ
jgi:hypothetical protein